MWIFSKYGFYSIVRTIEKRNPNEDYQIRARDITHLSSLLKESSLEKKIHCTLDADYRYRIIVSEDEYIHIMKILEKSIDYTNFKDAASKKLSEKWTKVLHDVWGLIYYNQK